MIGNDCIYDLGCAPSCGYHNTGLTLPVGTYYLLYKLRGNKNKLNFTVYEGGVVLLDMGSFPLLQEVFFSIYEEDGTTVTIEIEDVVYNVFRLKTEISQEVSDYTPPTTGSWEEQIIYGNGTNTVVPLYTILPSDFIIIDRNGVTMIKDNSLTKGNSYKFVGTSIVMDMILDTTEYIKILKLNVPASQRPSVGWQQVIQGDGTDTYETDNYINDSDFIQVFIDGILSRPDTELSDVNTYKVEGGIITFSNDIESDSYIHILKF